MNWFLSRSTRSKLLLSFGLVIVFLAIIVGVAYHDITGVQQTSKSLLDYQVQNELQLTHLQSHQHAIRASMLAIMALTDPARQRHELEFMETMSKENSVLLQSLLDRTRDDSDYHAGVVKVAGLRELYRQTRDDIVIPLVIANRTGEARTSVLGVEDSLTSQMDVITEGLIAHAAREVDAGIADSDRSSSRAKSIFLVVALAALMASVALTLFLDRITARPLRQVTDIAKEIARGNLAMAVPESGRSDEVGSLVAAFGQMAQNLRDMIGQIRAAVDVLGTSVNAILSTSAQVASGATETASAVSETTTTVEEVRQTSQLANQKAQYVSETAQKTSIVSQTGRRSVEETIESMNRIREQMDFIAKSVLKLSEASETIADITSTVNDLAEQSNLLAVNAAIEAAKAGEHGKGFAVVAQEIKSLAEQSKQATSQVRTILNDVQKSVGGAVMVTEQGGKAVEAGVKQTAEAGESIRQLTDTITEAAQASIQVVASSQQQLVGMDQVALAMENIKQASYQNVESSRLAESAAQQLQTLGSTLKQLTAKYTI
jgi:methyl-accepting chemotaxis protein